MIYAASRRVRARLARLGLALAAICALLATGDPARAADTTGIGGVEVRLLSDVAYGPDQRQRLDAYLPLTPGAAAAPVILMVHGGGWLRGDKEMGRVVDNKVARWVPKGFILVSVNYPMVPEADPVQQAEHVARAIAAAQQAAPGWGGDPGRFILMGHSAGAHLVSLLNADAGRAIELGARPWLGTISLDSGALDVPAIMNHKHPKLYDRAFGEDRDLWQAASPIHQLTPDAKPWLGVCSRLRSSACVGNAAFAAKARSLGARAEVLGEKLRHGAINEDLGLPGAYTDSVEDFMASLDPRVKALLGK